MGMKRRYLAVLMGIMVATTSVPAMVYAEDSKTETAADAANDESGEADASDENGDESADASASAGNSQSAGGNGSQAERIIVLLGGRENITLVDACMTRLRVTVKDPNKVADLPAWKAEGALGLLKKDNGIQAVYGPKADVLKSDINDIL